MCGHMQLDYTSEEEHQIADLLRVLKYSYLVWYLQL